MDDEWGPMSDGDSGDFFWSFITGALIAISFKLVWWLIKMTWRLLVWMVRGMGQLTRWLRSRGQMKALEQADHLSRTGRAEEALPVVQGVLDSGNRGSISMGVVLDGLRVGVLRTLG